jgi:predicted DNA-binding ribbon-helix-helix protein
MNSLALHTVNTQIHTEQDFWTGISEAKNEQQSTKNMVDEK